MPTISQWLGLDKLQRFFIAVKQNGGIRASFYKIYRIDELRIGTLVGVDKFGNKYFENREYYHPRDRWVEYSDDVHLDYDASQISAEWWRWMHHTTDIPPTVEPPIRHKWMVEYTPNLSGTPLQYVPYSTVNEKIQKWNKQLPQTDVKQLK